MNKKNVAFLVVDFNNEFTYGKVKSSRAIHCIKPAKELIDFAHQNKIQVIFVNDVHDKKDKELKIWGLHSLNNTKSSKIIDDFNVSKEDIIIPKHTYSGFFNTNLNKTLKKLNIKTLIIFGLYLNICVKFTLIDAYLNGFDNILAIDATDAFTLKFYKDSIAEIKTITDTKLLHNKEIFKLIK